jgi:hypothetical protein
MRTLALFLLLTLVACSKSYPVAIEMEAKEGALVRSLQARSGFSTDTRRRVMQAYDEENATSASATFEGDLPGEFGGSGFHHRFTSDLGTLTFYSERLEPERNPWELVEIIERGVDRCLDLLLPWVAHEFAPRADLTAELAEQAPAIRAWLKGRILELALAPTDDAFALLGHGIMEAGLLEWADVPRLFAEGDDSESETLLLVHLRRWFAQRLELAPEAAELAFLADRDAFVAHWRAWIAAGGARGLADPPDAESTPGVALELLTDEIDFPLFKDTERVSVALRVTVEPLETNGHHDPAAGRITWREVDLLDSATQPVHRYAWWVEPDHARQALLFGTLRLDGEKLSEYVLWYESLTTEARSRWSQELERLAATPELEEPWKLRLGDAPEFEQGLRLLESGLEPVK